MNFKVFFLIALVFACFVSADLQECKKTCEMAHDQCKPAPSAMGPTCGDQLARCNFYCEKFGRPFIDSFVSSQIKRI